MADQSFALCTEFPVAICRECRHAVWPDQMEAHLLGSNHQLQSHVVASVLREVHIWSGVLEDSSQLELPAAIERPIDLLPVYADGLQCILKSDECHYICRTEKALKKHWAEQHQWSVGSIRGRPTAERKLRIEQQFDLGRKIISCQ